MKMFECNACTSPHLKKLKEYAKRTPFTYSELARLSKKFTELDEDGSGTLSTEVKMQANYLAHHFCSFKKSGFMGGSELSE